VTDLSPDDPSPLWMQAVDAIMADVREGRLRPGMRLPAERDLCQQLNISRVTLRRALAKLVEDGVLKSSHGRGWYVAGPASLPARRRDWPNRLESFTETARRMGLSASSTVLRKETSAAGLDEAEKLGVAPGTRVFRLSRVRLLDDVAIAVDDSTVAVDQVPGIESADFATASLYQQVLDAGIELARAECSIEARAASADVATLLGMEAGEPILRMDQVALNETDRPIFTTTISYHGERYRLRTAFVRGRS
jgi:GntR family transcriptional regulator